MRTRTASAAGAAVVLAHVEVAVAVEFDDPRQAGGEVGGELVVVDGGGAGDEELVPAGVGEPLGEVALVVVDEEVGVQVADLRRPPRGGPAARSTAPSRPGGSPARCSATVSQRCRKSAPASAVPTPGKRQAQGYGVAVGVEQLRGRGGGPRVGVERRDQRRGGPGPQFGVLVQQQAVAAPAPAPSGVESFSALPVRRSQLDQLGCRRRAPAPPRPSRRSRRCRGRGSRARPRPGGSPRSRPGRRAGTRGRSCSPRSRRASGAKRATIIGRVVHPDTRPPMRVQLVDPSAFTPPYDRALAAALARGGRRGRAGHDQVPLRRRCPQADGYEVDERFYRRSAARGLASSARLPFKGAEHLRDMLAFRRAPTTPTSSTTSG